jgi:hypothetical protein
MTECFNPEIKEQLPDLAAEKLDAASRARALEHIQSCTSCTEEHEILRMVRTVQMPVPFINVSKIVRALPPAPLPVRAELPWYRRASIQMAAAFLLVAGGLISVRQAGDRVDSQASKVAAVAPESMQSPAASAVTTDNSSAPAAAVRRAAAPVPANGIALVAGLDEMTTAELTSLLQEVDDLAAVPVAEPEQFSPVNASSDSQGES